MFRKLLLSRIFIVPTTTTSFSYRYLSVTPSTVLKTEDLSHPSHRRAKIYNLKLGQLMKYYNDLNQNEKSLKLFDSTLAKGIKPDSHIYSLALLTCANLKNLDKGKWLHKLVESSSEIDIIENNIIKISLMKMYSQCGQMKECENIFFEQIRQHDIHTYTGMMQCYDYNQMAEKIIILFEKMRRNDQHIQPSVTLYMLILRACAKLRNLEKGKEIHELVTQKSMMKSQILSIIIDMYSQCFDVKSAEILFQTQTKYSVYTYNSMMKCYNLNQMPQRTLELYAKMKFKKKQEEIEMNVQTFINVLQACSMIAHVCLEDGQAVHAELLYKYKNLTKSIELQIALIQFYGHSGDVQSAKKIFDQLGKGRRTIEIWNALLNSYAINARTNEVLKLFKQMKQDGFIPQSQTYSIVLYSYGQLKMIEEAKILFESIEEKNNYIYGTMIDTLVRNKRYDEAQLLIEQYEKENVSNPILYLIVLDAAKNDGNVIEISKITEKLKQFENKIDLQYYTSSHVKLGKRSHSLSADVGTSRTVTSLFSCI
ncbi:unnamed protein product, partial [Didymodactylos carnosus]